MSVQRGFFDLDQPVANLRVITPQHPVRAVDQCHMCAEFMEDASKLIGDVAATGNHNALGACAEMEHFVGGDAMFRAFNLRDHWPGAGGDQYIFCRDHPAAGELYRMPTGNCRSFSEQPDLVAFQRIAIKALQPVDIGQHIVAQLRPVEIAIGDVPAKTPRVFQILREMRAIDQ